jgi:hypothetical protein
MTSPTIVGVLPLFRHVLAKPVLEKICERNKATYGSGIYNVATVLWLMIVQRVQMRKTLLAVVHSFCQGQIAAQFSSCKRVRQGRISPQSGRFLPSAAATF